MLDPVIVGKSIHTKLCVCPHNVAIGRTLRSFPRSKPRGPISRHAAFQLGRTTSYVRIGRCRPQGAPVGRCLPSSAFPAPSVCIRFVQLPLADLHPVLPITARHLATPPPPSSRPCAGIFAPQCWVQRLGSSLIPTGDVLAPRSCLLYAGWNTEAVRHTGTHEAATTVPFWLWRLSQFRHLGLTTLYAQVSLVSIGHRARVRSAELARRLAPLSVGFPPQDMPCLDAGHSALVSLLKHGSR